MELSEELRGFVEGLVGDIRSVAKPESGSSRITYLIEAERQDCVLRVDSGDGPVANTPLTLAREAAAYRALAGSKVKIPALIGETRDAFLMSWAAGTPDLAALEPEARYRVMDSYVEALAELHRVDASSGFEALDPPPDAASAARHGLALWSGIYRARVSRASPLAHFATAWLEKHAPDDAPRLSVCHGDVGPGNFMHDGEQVTALLDWEFVHVGDPMDDFAWLAFRGHQLGSDIGDFDAQLDLWQKLTGFEVSRRRIAWYRVMTMYIFLVSCLAALDQGAKQQDRFVYLNLVNVLNVLMPRAMMLFSGIAVPEPQIALETEENEMGEQLEALVDLMRIGREGGAEAPAGYTEVMAQQMLRLARWGRSIDAQNAEAISVLIGRAVAPDEAARAFHDWIAGGEGEDEAVLAMLYENGLRRMQVDIAYQPAAEKPLLPL
jgi:aminoglycoside phosphotransferase (APT) family kinase protein